MGQIREQMPSDFRICNFCKKIIRGKRAYASKCPYCKNPNKIIIEEDQKSKPKGIGVLIRGEAYHKREENRDLRKWINKPVHRDKKGRVIHTPD